MPGRVFERRIDMLPASGVVYEDHKGNGGSAEHVEGIVSLFGHGIDFSCKINIIYLNCFCIFSKINRRACNLLIVQVVLSVTFANLNAPKKVFIFKNIVMKKLVLSLAVVCSLIAMGQVANAQENSSETPGFLAKENRNSRAHIEFLRTHPSFETLDWYAVEGGYMVHDAAVKNPSHEYYTNSGRWIATITTVPVENLSGDIVALVKNTYSCYDIFFAQEMKAPQGLVYLLKIEKGDDWKDISVHNGEIKVKRSYKRVK